VLVANAGGGRGRPVDTKASSLDPALLQLVVEMNLFGTVYSCNAVAPIMKQQRSGRIITVSSVAGTAPSAEAARRAFSVAQAEERKELSDAFHCASVFLHGQPQPLDLWRQALHPGDL
jgi:NAD(P)-dependent dehydrogenase (short-subunit alcohol dehydrogenase family)